MGAPDRTGWVTLQYDGAKSGVPHLRSAFTVKQVRFADGVAMEVSPKFADLAIKAAPPGSLKVVKGKPEEYAVKSPAQVEAEKARDRRVGASIEGVGARPVPEKPEAPAVMNSKV